MITYYEIELKEDSKEWEIIKDCDNIDSARKSIKEFKREDKKEGVSNIMYRIIANIRTEVF